jgi:rhamnosyl/mannosyltransferase
VIERFAGLRVCHLGKYYPPARGGIETHVQGLARAQAALGARVQVLCINHADEEGRDVSWRALARTRTVRERDGEVEVIRLGRQANIARLDVTARLPALLHEAMSGGADVLHLHVPNPTFLLATAMLRADHVPLVITHHSDIVRQRLLRHAVRPLEEVVYRRSSAVLTTSPAYARSSALLRAHASKVHVVPLGVETRTWVSPDPASMASLRARIGGVGDEPLWLSVGRLVYYKGLSTAVRALARVPGRWVVIGTGPEGQSLQALAAELGVADRIVWLGEVEPAQLVAAFHLASALWFPSNARSEAFGLVQVEAMAAGCPVVNCSIDGSGVAWVAPHGEAALTVPRDDVASFAAAASRLLGSSELRGRLAEGARRRARAFEQADIAARTLALYAEAVGAA